MFARLCGVLSLKNYLGSITGDGGNEIAGSKEKEFGAMDTILKALSTCVVFLQMMPKVKPSIPLSTFTFVNNSHIFRNNEITNSR